MEKVNGRILGHIYKAAIPLLSITYRKDKFNSNTEFDKQKDAMQNQKEFDANQVSNKDCRDAMADDCSDLRIGTRSYQKFTQGSPHSWGTIKESLGGTGKITLEPLGSSPNGFGSANIHQERRNAAEFTGMVNFEGHGKVEPRDS